MEAVYVKDLIPFSETKVKNLLENQKTRPGFSFGKKGRPLQAIKQALKNGHTEVNLVFGDVQIQGSFTINSIFVPE